MEGGGVIYAEGFRSLNAVIDVHLRVMDGNHMLRRSVRRGHIFAFLSSDSVLFSWLLVTGRTTPAQSQNAPLRTTSSSPSNTRHRLAAAVDRRCHSEPRFTISSAPAPLCGAGVKQWSQRDIAELMDLPLPLSPPSLFMCVGIHRDLMAPTERDAASLKRAQEIKSKIRNAPAELAGKQFRQAELNQRYFYLFIFLNVTMVQPFVCLPF